MLLYPDYYCKNICQLDIEFFQEHHIKGIILDVDNTLIDRNKILSHEIMQWHQQVKQHGIKTMILSNSIKKNKVAKIAEELETKYIHFARKPFKSGMKNAIQMLKLNPEEIAVIGDQIFSDVLGANRMKLYSILVEPLSTIEPFRVKWQRPLEKWIMQKYLKNR